MSSVSFLLCLQYLRSNVVCRTWPLKHQSELSQCECWVFRIACWDFLRRDGCGRVRGCVLYPPFWFIKVKKTACFSCEHGLCQPASGHAGLKKLLFQPQAVLLLFFTEEIKQIQQRSQPQRSSFGAPEGNTIWKASLMSRSNCGGGLNLAGCGLD